ncbi:MAG: biotin operon repressor [Christensenellaceae bacterium]
MTDLIGSVLALLSKTEDYVSGQQLADSLGVSRTAIWKAVNELRSSGYPIESEKKSGYRLLPTEKPFAEGIEPLLTFPCALFVHQSLPSTEAEAKRLLPLYGSVLVIAENQTAGVGKSSSDFPSPPGGTYFTLGFQRRFPLGRFLSLREELLALIADALHAVRIGHEFFVEQEKVGGVLVETSSEFDEGTSVVIGVGYRPSLSDKNQTIARIANGAYALLWH